MAGLIQPRTDWKYRLSSLFRSQDVPLFPPPEIPTHKTKLRVLSLFDGIGTGLLALDRLNLCVEEYYSCEIDSDAISVTQQHFGDRITNLGDIRELTKEKLISLLPIDLLVGGSPCNDLSLANPKRKGIGGKLKTCNMSFFVLMCIILKICRGLVFYFLIFTAY